MKHKKNTKITTRPNSPNQKILLHTYIHMTTHFPGLVQTLQ